MKRLIVCCDGTWNTAEQEEGGVPTPTNVRKIYNAVADVGPDGTRQLRYYHPGVGTEGGFLARIAGGVYGRGISSNVKSGYQWLARNYEPGDEIYLYGFSRGAYTARSLGGMLGSCGLLDLTGLSADQGWARVDAVYDKRYRERKKDAVQDFAFHDDGRPIPIALVGVWDTVGALGIPNDLEILNLFDDPKKWQFHDVDLGDNVASARHAVAIDEVRSSFTPTLWNERDGDDDRIIQMWFPGVHSDVGGGYAETGLSDGALLWMIAESRKLDLAFNEWMVESIHPDPSDVLHESFTSFFKALRSRPRALPPLHPGRSESNGHESAFQRQVRPPLNQAPYRTTTVIEPGATESVSIYARDRWNDCGLFLEAGEYRLTASGEWLDSGVRSGPAGTDDGDFHAGETLHAMMGAWGQVEKLWRRATDNESTDFIGTRRAEDYPWMSLVGVVANDEAEGNPTPDGSPRPHHAFLIGEGCDLKLDAPGYLYAFANDAWIKYDNNRGSVLLKIERVR